MFRGIIDFFSRWRLPSAPQLFGMFYRARTSTGALTTFNTIIADLENVAGHHAGQAGVKAAFASALQRESQAHIVENQSATAVAGKLKALLV